MGDIIYIQEVIVMDLFVDGVIGLDFMKKYKCIVDVLNGYFNVQDMCYKVEFVGKIGCFRIVVKEIVVIFLRSEVVIYCCVMGFFESYQNKEIMGLVELVEKFVKFGKVLVVRLVGYLKNGEIFVRMMNFFEDNQIIYFGIFIVNLSNVELVIDFF